MKHAWNDEWKPAEGLGLVQVCRTCGVMRKSVKGVLHYYTKHEHKGTGLHDACPVNDFRPTAGVHGTPASTSSMDSRPPSVDTRMPVERIAMLWNSLPLETDAASVVTFVRAVEDFHGIADGVPPIHKESSNG